MCDLLSEIDEAAYPEETITSTCHLVILSSTKVVERDEKVKWYGKTHHAAKFFNIIS